MLETPAAQDPRQDPPRPLPGRRSKLTPEVSKRLNTALRAGNYLEVAARYAGVGLATLMLWMKRGREAQAALDAQKAGKPLPVLARGRKPTAKQRAAPPLDTVPASEMPYVELVDMIKSAEAEGEMRAVLAVTSAMRENWTAAMTFLERKHPDRWGRRDRLDLNFDPKKLSTEELLTLDELMTKAQRED